MNQTKTRQRTSFAELYSRFGVFLILIIALIVGTIISRDFLVPSNLFSVAQNVSIYAIIAIGMTRLLIGGGRRFIGGV